MSKQHKATANNTAKEERKGRFTYVVDANVAGSEFSNKNAAAALKEFRSECCFDLGSSVEE